MATVPSIAVALSAGSAIPDAMSAAQRTRGWYIGAISAMKGAAREAGKSLALASSADQALVYGRGASKVKRTLHARDAYHARVLAESEKYRAAYLGLALKAREAVVAALRAASAFKGKSREEAVKRASWESEKAEALERAAAKVERIKGSVGESDVVSVAEARRVAVDAGVSFSRPSDTVAIPVTGSNMFSQGPSNVAALIPEFFPQEVQQAASALSGTADEVDWWGAVKRSLGMGAASVGDAATRVGQEETKNNPAAGALVAGIGGALQALSSVLGVQFNAGAGASPAPAEPSEFPWPPVIAGALLLGGLYLFWRSA